MARSALVLTLVGAMMMLGAWQSTDFVTARAPRRADAADPELERQIDVLVDRLASDSWAEREAATQALRALPMPQAQAPLVARLARGGLDVEQRHRLADLVSRRLTEQPRGAIGITMTPLRGNTSGVRVGDLVPGMPAVDVLRVGDVIESINDERIRTSADLSDIVQELAPGTSIRIRVQRPVLDDQERPRRDRDGQVVTLPTDLTLRLGSMEQLETDRHKRDGGVVISRIQRDRLTEATDLVRDHAARATIVRIALDESVAADSFSSTLSELEQFISHIERGGSGDRVDRAGLLDAATRQLDELNRLQGETAVSDQDRQRLAMVLRRLALALSDDGLLEPIDRSDVPAR